MENIKLAQLSNEWIPEVTIDEVQAKLNSGEITSKELVLMYLARIASYDQELKSIIEINPDALQIAASLDAERRHSGSRGSLHGIPVLIKDNIDTNDKMHTTAGSKALQHSYARKDSFVASQLRKAGAIILGKTNLTEWANFMTMGMPSGYSSRGGQTLNPYGPGKYGVGGSSAGSGAAMAANFATVAVGTETSGSIINPSCQNALVGVKPTVGLISRAGIIPISHTQDTAGSMTRTVKDAAILLNALVGQDENDPVTLTNTDLIDVDFTSALHEHGLKGIRIGYAKEPFFEQEKFPKEKQDIFHAAIEKLIELGAIVEEVEIPSAKSDWDWKVLDYEFKSGVNAYLKTVDPTIPVRTLADVIEFNLKDEEEMLKYGQILLQASEETSGTLTEGAYLRSLERSIHLSTERGIDYALNHYNVEAILFPHDLACDIPARAGYPSVCVPAGFTEEGEPVGVTFTGNAFSEIQLLTFAYAFEQATKHRKPPVLKN